MSKLEELIAELCPDGVEFKALGVICLIKTGAKPQSKANVVSGKYAYINAGLEPSGYCENSNADGDAITIPSRGYGGAGYVGYQHNDFWCGPLCYKIYSSNSNVITRFVFFYLTSIQANIIALRKTGSIPAVNRSDLLSLMVPVPPLPVQSEIVRILDNFTKLTAELTAELTARKKQYEYYRNRFFDDLIDHGVQKEKIGDFCDLLTGNPFDSSQFTETGIRLMRGMNIKRGVLDFSESNNRYWKNDEGLEKYHLRADDIVISMDGSLVGKSYSMVSEKQIPLLLVQRVARIRTEQANIHYVYHYIASGAFSKYVDLKKTAGAIPHISLKDIANFTIPMPDIQTQAKIALVLDRFDTLCNDISTGLPAEIEARQKQYEYYRDKLLTFKELS